MPQRFQPNTIGNIRHAVAIPLIILIAASPVEVMFVQALIDGQQAAAGILGFCVVPLWVLTPVAIWGFYADRRKLQRAEFSEPRQPDDAGESR